MSDSILIAAASACWLGILTSISPCPLASNIAAISYIGRKVSRPRYVIATGLVYTLGRTLTYVVLGVLIIASALAIPDVSFFLQRNINKFLGLILVLTGILLLGLFRIGISGPGFGDGLQRRVDKWGIWGAGILGILFALAFCPVSAALFFGGLMPIAVEQESRILLPMLYGVGTALPVVVFSLLLAFGTRFVGKVFDRLTQFEVWARKITALVFIVIGIYMIVNYTI